MLNFIALSAVLQNNYLNCIHYIGICGIFFLLNLNDSVALESIRVADLAYTQISCTRPIEI